MLQACLGLQFDARKREIRFRRPVLPLFIDELVIRRLRLGQASVDVLLSRYDNDVSVNVLQCRGELSVGITLS